MYADVGRGVLRRRIERVGAVDLDFQGDGGWRLLVELKIDAGFGDGQQPRYLRTRHPLLAIVRDPALPQVESESKLATNGLGAVSWEAVVPVMRALPVEPTTDATQWQELLDIAVKQGDLTKRSSPRAKTGAAATEAAGGRLASDPDGIPRRTRKEAR